MDNTCSHQSCPAQHHTTDEALGIHLNTIAELNNDDLTLVISFIDALVTKTRL